MQLPSGKEYMRFTPDPRDWSIFVTRALRYVIINKKVIVTSFDSPLNTLLDAFSMSSCEFMDIDVFTKVY